LMKIELTRLSAGRKFRPGDKRRGRSQLAGLRARYAKPVSETAMKT
jgi:hypothetical protein